MESGRDDAWAGAFPEALVEALPQTIWLTSRTGQTLYVSRRALEFTGLRMDELTGRAWLDVIHPDDRERTRETLEAAVANEAPYAVEHRVRRHDGVYVWHLVRGAPIRDAHGEIVQWVGTSIDIAREREARDELAEKSAQLELLFRCAPVGIGFIDLELRFVSVNESLAEMSGLPANEHVGRPVEDVLPEIAQKAEGRIRAVLERGEPLLDLECEVHTPAFPGTTRIWLASYFPVPGPEGRPHGVGVVVLDITTRRRLEARFLQAQKLEAIGRLSSAIAHDFNNLLTAIGGFAHLAQRHYEQGRDPTAELREVMAATERSALLVRQLLTFTSAEREEVGCVDVNARLGELTRLLQVVAGDGVRLDFRLTPGLPQVSGNAGAFEQIVVNLAANARDAMEEGGQLTISTEELALDEAGAAEYDVEPGGFVALRVADEGHGMDEATRSQALTPFFTTKERSKGSGLGLSTVYGLVHRFGGGIDLASRPTGGTTVTVVLPVVAVPEPAAEDEAASGIGRGNERILVAEDVEPVRRFVVEALTEAGYEVLDAASGEEALELADGERIDLLLSDIVMPGINGPELADRLCARDQSLRVLLMSGYAEEDMGDREFILKPFDTYALTSRIRRILDA